MSPGDIPYIRLSVFIGLFVLLAVCEALWPLRAHQDRVGRWPANLGLSILNTAMVRVLAMLVPVAALATAAEAFSSSGVLRVVGLDGLLLQGAGFAILDAAVYAQHRIFHAVPGFWKFHQVHHADLMLDVSSAIRFHSVEILISQIWKVLVVIAAGVPLEAAIAFEIVLNASSMFSHANVALPGRMEGLVRLLIVTPGMHRIHHSTQRDEMDSNFGFNFSVWDRLLGTYVPSARASEDRMEMGLPDYRDRSTASFAWLMQLPFRKGSVT